MRIKLAALIVTSMLAAGCGDVSRLELTFTWADPNVDAATQQLLFVVREPPAQSDGCDALWGPQPGGLAEFTRLVDYPNRNDVVAAPLDVGNYTILVYAYPTRIDMLCGEDADCTESQIGTSCRSIGADKKACMAGDAELAPIGGGCAGGIIDPNGATELRMMIDNRP